MERKKERRDDDAKTSTREKVIMPHQILLNKLSIINYIRVLKTVTISGGKNSRLSLIKMPQ